MSLSKQPAALVTIEPHLAEAQRLVEHIQSTLHQPRYRRLKNAFTSLAGGDVTVGLLAYYLWRRAARR